MKASDIVQHLAAVLPKYTNKFTRNVAVSALSQVAGVATATATAHGLVVGDQANIQGAKPPIPITTLTRSGTTGTMITAVAHDLTAYTGATVEIEGAVEANFNGTFTILTVPDRYTITFTMVDSGATTATGTPVLLNGANYLNQYDGLREVLTVPDANTFTFAVNATTPSPAHGTIEARCLPQVSAVVSEEIIANAYTRQDAPTDLWAFVVLGDVVANRSRDTNTDATSDVRTGDYFRQLIIQPMTIYVVVPSALENAARSARDLCEELLQPLTKSLLFKRFPTYLAVSDKGALQFTGHGFAGYARGYYMHAFQFEQMAELTFDDTIGYDDNVAFRDITIGITPQQGNQVEVLTANINLDDTGV